MTIELQPIEVDRSEALAWMEYSLRQGFDISMAVLTNNVFDDGRFLTLVPGDFKRSPINFAAGGVIPLNSFETALSEFFEEIAGRNAASVVVEDDMRDATNVRLAKETEPLAFVGERILHWCDLRDGGQACTRTIVMGSHWYPLNAFVSSSTSVQLGLVDRQQTTEDLPQRIVESLIAVVVAAFDSESFLIWVKTDQK